MLEVGSDFAVRFESSLRANLDPDSKLSCTRWESAGTFELRFEIDVAAEASKVKCFEPVQ